MKQHNIYFIFLLLVTGMMGCSLGEPDFVYEVPEKADDGWEVAHADANGLQSNNLSEMMDFIEATEDHHIHSILILKNDLLVFEHYFEGYLYSNNPPGSNGDFIQYSSLTDHYLASVTKSVTSVIFGAAVKEGFISDVDEPLVDIMPQYDSILTGEKAEITLRHLLTMSSGLHWDEWSSSFENPANDVRALFNEDDPIAYILSKHMTNSPGDEFHYNSGGTNVLGAVVEVKTGMGLLDFGNQYLFDPLNIQGGKWETMAGGYMFASGGLYLRPRELTKIGSLFLNDGYWGEQQIITPDWISQSTYPYIETDNLIPQSDAYGYQWWIMDFQANGQTYDCFFAAGWGDQYMFIFPAEEMIVTIHCGNFLQGGSISIFNLVENFILSGLIE